MKGALLESPDWHELHTLDDAFLLPPVSGLIDASLYWYWIDIGRMADAGRPRLFMETCQGRMAFYVPRRDRSFLDTLTLIDCSGLKKAWHFDPKRFRPQRAAEFNLKKLLEGRFEGMESEVAEEIERQLYFVDPMVENLTWSERRKAVFIKFESWKREWTT